MDPELKQVESHSIAVELAEWAVLGIALLLLTATEKYGTAAIASLILLAVFFVESAFRGTLSANKTGLELPLLLFVISAASAALISYNSEGALLQFARILASAAAFYLLSNRRSPFPRIAAWLFICAAAILALYWPVQNDFTLTPGKLPIITAIGRLINAITPGMPGPDIHSNVAAGSVLVAIPLSVSLFLQAKKNGQKSLAFIASALSVLLLFGLFMTSSRGAWMGLVGMSLAALMVFAFSRSQALQRNAKPVVIISLLILVSTSLLLFSIISPTVLLGQISDPNGSLQSRWDLWQEGFLLIQDYLFTGSGLQSFWMVHAIYALLIHVPYLAHIHNSFLQIWIEQGILGPVSIVWGMWVISTWVWRSIKAGSGTLLGWAGFAAICGAAIHGMVDVVFYVERTLPVIGLLLGFASQLSYSPPSNSESRQKRKSDIIRVPVIAGLAVVVLFIFNQPVQALWHANLGSLWQTQVELKMYNPVHFDDPTIDQVRQAADLVSAKQSLEKALSINQQNRTSLHRLSMIAIARREYDQALDLMETSWQAGQRDPRTRLLYADALVASGQPEKAAEIASGLTWAEARFLGQAWSRYWENQDYQRAAYAYQAVLALNPNNIQAREGLVQLEQFQN